MYCSFCSAAIAPGLSYCNQCGARLKDTRADDLVKSPEVKPEILVAAIAFVFVGGLGAIIGMMAALKWVFNQPGEMGLIIFFTLISFLFMLGIEAVFIWKLFGRRRSVLKARDTEQLEGQDPKELSPAQARLLQEPALSVTEHTTRDLESADLKRGTP